MDVDKEVKKVVANMEIEGFHLSAEEIQNCHDILTGVKLVADCKAEVLKKYTALIK